MITVFRYATVFVSSVCFVVDVSANFQNDKEFCGPVEEEEIQVCLRPMLDYATTLQNHGLLPLEGAQVFQKLCGLYSDFTQCADNIGCGSVSLNAMDASYGYMCGQGFHLFSKHVNCFAKVENEQEYLICKNTATTGVSKIQFNPVYSSEYFQSLCSVMQTYLKCSKPIILDQCGKEAWDLVTRVTKDSLEVTMPGCNLKSFLVE